VTDHIFEKIGYNLHKRPDHPLGIIKAVIGEYFDDKFGAGSFTQFDDQYPIVTTYANFDSVLVPPDHVSRGSNDTYYVDSDRVLRCHTSAHQAEMLKDGARKFLVTGDVYRRDSIDATHFPVFHQMEGVRVFEPEEWEAAGVDAVDMGRAVQIILLNVGGHRDETSHHTLTSILDTYLGSMFSGRLCSFA
jgi:phenylalanyl-tRNA synthetase alpha chain